MQPIAPCVTERMSWSLGICKVLVGMRSYEIKIGHMIYQCNWYHLIHTNESLDTDDSTLDPQTIGQDSDSTSAEQDIAPPSPNTMVTQDPPTPCRSQRNYRTSPWVEDIMYHLN